MRKLAVFVEGQAERIWLEKLFPEIIGRHRLRLESQKVFGGRKFDRTLYEFRTIAPPDGREHRVFVLLTDCGADGRVTSEIRDQFASLSENGYNAILGMRDVYPFSIGDKTRLQEAFHAVMPGGEPEPLLILATMEVEAWFIAEHTHFVRLDPMLTPGYIRAATNLDVTGNIEVWPRPSQNLDAIYQLAGMAYRKAKAEVERTVAATDFAQVYLHTAARVPSLGPLLRAVDHFLS